MSLQVPAASSSLGRRHVATVALLGLLALAPLASAQDAVPAAGAGMAESVTRTIGLAAAAATTVSISLMAAAYAVARVGAAALGAAAEKPELLGRSLLFVALVEGLAVLGFAIAMILTQKI